MSEVTPHEKLFMRVTLAQAALNGMLANSSCAIDWKNSKQPVHEVLAKQAVKYADAVWNELEKE